MRRTRIRLSRWYATLRIIMKHNTVPTAVKPSRFLFTMLLILTLATLAAAPQEIYHWYQQYPWWWTVNALGVYVISLISLYGVFRMYKWGLWLSVGSTLAAPLYLRPNDKTLISIHGAVVYIGLYGALIGLYWYAVRRNWENFR